MWSRPELQDAQPSTYGRSIGWSSRLQQMPRKRKHKLRDPPCSHAPLACNLVDGIWLTDRAVLGILYVYQRLLSGMTVDHQLALTMQVPVISAW
jgi:hypothetical protein